MSHIEASEGLYAEALRSQMSAHQLIKSPYKWDISITATFRLLMELDKLTDANGFLDKLSSTFQDCLKNKDFEDAHTKLGWCLGTVYLCTSELVLKALLSNFDKDQFKVLTGCLKKYASIASKYGSTVSHTLQISRLMAMCEKEISKRPVADDKAFKNAYRIVDTFIKLGHKMDTLVKANLKYIFSPGLDSKIRSPLITFHNRMKLALARLYIVFGDLAMKADHKKISIKKIEAVEIDEDGLDQELLETEKEAAEIYKEMPEKHVAYLNKLSREIEMMSLKSKKRMDNFERAVALSREVQNSSFLLEDTTAAKVEVFRGLRRRNKKVKNLTSDSEAGEEKSDLDQITPDEREKILKGLFSELKEIKALVGGGSADAANSQIPNGFLDYTRNEEVFRILKRLSLEELEIWTGGQGGPEETISSLAKFQDYQTLDYLAEVVKLHSRKTSRPFLLKKLLQTQHEQSNYLDQALVDELKTSHKLVQYFNTRMDFFDMVDKLPNQGSAIFVQLSEDGSDLFIGFVRKQDDKLITDAKKFKLPDNCSTKLDGLVQSHTTAVVNYYKTPILTQGELKNLENVYSEELSNIRKELESIFEPYLAHLDEFINKEPAQEAPEEVPQVGKLGSPAFKPKEVPKKPDPKAAPGKGAPTVPAENVKPTKSGIESMVLLIDERYILLPFELNPLFKSVTLLSKDFSLQTYTKRTQVFTPETGGDNLAVKKTQFIAYDFKEAEGELKDVKSPIQFSLLTSALKESKNINLQGVNAIDRLPSIGNWQLALRESDTFIYYGNKPFLHVLSPATLLDLTNTSKVRSFIICDRLNPLKKNIKKYDSLEPDQEFVQVKEMPKLTLALFTLMGAGVVLFNKGPINPEYNLDMLFGILTSLTTESMSFSSSLKTHRRGRKTLILPTTSKPLGLIATIKSKASEKKEEPAVSGRKPPAAPTSKKPQEEADKGSMSDGRDGVREEFEEYPQLYKEQFSVLGVGTVRFANAPEGKEK